MSIEAGGKQKTQVVIIGAGPTGLSMAAQLLRYGINFIILEKNEHTTSLSKAVVVQARSMEIFRELNLSGKALAGGRITRALNLVYKGKILLNADLNNLGEGLTAFPFALSLEQSKTEKLLADHLTENNIPVHWRSSFTGFVQHKDGVTVSYIDHEGAPLQIEADYIIGCDGAPSVVRHAMGQELKGDTVPKIFYVADVAINSTMINRDELFIFMIKKGFVIFFPLEGADHYRVIGILPDGDPDKEYVFEELESFITEQVRVPISFKKVFWFSTYKVHSRKADHFMAGRCFIAGDAAHIHTPAGGQGMNTGIQDAYNLAWKLSAVLKNELKSEVLDTYDKERSGNAVKLLKTTDRMFDLMAGVNRFWNFIRLNIFPPLIRLMNKSRSVKRNVFPLLSQTGIAYPHSTLSVAGNIGAIRSGARMPYFILNNGENIFDRITKPAFKLLFFGAGSETDVFRLFQNIKLSVEKILIKDIPQSLFGTQHDFYILLRPDNHISFIGKEPAECLSFLQKICV